MNQRAGIGRYSRSLVSRLLPLIDDLDPTLWVAMDDDPLGLEPSEWLSPEDQSRPILRSRVSRLTVDRILFRRGMSLPRFLMNTRSATVSYSPDFTTPRGNREIVTIHDLAWRKAPERMPEGLRRFLDQAVADQLHRAAHVVTVSESVKQEIIELYRLPDRMITVAANAADERFFHAEEPTTALRRRLKLPGNYLLSVGTLEPRKNQVTAIRAVINGSDLPLVIVGGAGWDSEPIWAEIARASASGRVRYVGYVPERDLPSLYAGASGLLALSWYEGFNLPLIEALATGIPVLASDLPVHHEVAAEQAVYTNPASIQAVMAGIALLLDPTVTPPGRSEHRQARARRYSWDSSALAASQAIRMVAD